MTDDPHDTTCPVCDETFASMDKLDDHAYFVHDGATTADLDGLAGEGDE